MARFPSGVDEALLGFDAREMFLSPGTWDTARRDTFLFRRDVPKPLSVDSTVWPSLFGEGLPEHERTRLRLDTMRLPEWRGPNQRLWDNLDLMRASLLPVASVAHRTVAVSWVSADGFSKPSETLGPYREKMTPPASSDDWELLGFDVADGWLTSGLSNCGYEPAEVAALRASWGADLNDHHLFEDAERALAFKAVTDRRVPEHAPFFVYALFLVAA